MREGEGDSGGGGGGEEEPFIFGYSRWDGSFGLIGTYRHAV